MSTDLAPRDAASKPSAPVPAKASTQRQSVRSWPNQLNKVSRTRSGVGRNPGLSMTLILLRFHWPPMMRNSCEGEPVTGLATGVDLLRGLVLIGRKLNGLKEVS